MTVLQLAFLAPLDWETLLAHFRGHQMPGVETVTDHQYERVFEINGQVGYFGVSRGRAKAALRLEVSDVDQKTLKLVVARIREMFDLDADPFAVASVMERVPHLDQIWARHPGLRVARSWDRFQAMIATILGQIVSVSFGRTLLHELMRAYGERRIHPVTGDEIFMFPHAETLVNATLSEVRTSELRRTSIREISRLALTGAFSSDEIQDPKALRGLLRSIPGVGPWSCEYVAMRAFGDRDAFPATDYWLKQQIKRYATIDLKLARPFRAYAAIALWKDVS